MSNKIVPVLLMVMLMVSACGAAFASVPVSDKALEVTKSVDDDNVTVGEKVVFTITVSNPNGHSVTADLTDEIPDNFEIVTGAIPSNVNIAANDEVTYIIVAKAVKAGEYTNTVSASFKGKAKETVEADHDGWTLNAAKQVQQKQGQIPLNAQKFNIGTIKNGYKVVDDVGQGVNKIWVPVTYEKCVDKTFTSKASVSGIVNAPEEPVTPVEPVEPTEPVTPVEPVEPNTVPMQTTGAPFVPAVIGFLSVLAGIGLAAFRG